MKSVIKTYRIFYQKYNIFSYTYLDYVKIVSTDDIYHEIGILAVKSMNIRNIHYIELTDTLYDTIQKLYSYGYRKINYNTFVADGEQLWAKKRYMI